MILFTLCLVVFQETVFLYFVPVFCGVGSQRPLGQFHLLSTEG